MSDIFNRSVNTQPVKPGYVANIPCIDGNQNKTAEIDKAPPQTTALKSTMSINVTRILLNVTSSTSHDTASLMKLVPSWNAWDWEKPESWNAWENEDFEHKVEDIKGKNTIAMQDAAGKTKLLSSIISSSSSSSSSESSTVLSVSDLNSPVKVVALPVFNRNAYPIMSGFQFSSSSSKEICDAVAAAIASMGENYLDVFQEAVEVFASFYSDFSEAIASLKKYIKADGDKMVFDGRGFAAELKTVIDKYSGDAGVLYHASSVDEAKAWAREMGLDPDKCVDGTNVRIDLSSVQKLYTDTYQNNNVTLNSAQWASYQSSVDVVKDSVQTSMQSLTQKYSNANSTFDNLVKVLSSTISQLLESDKSFFNI